MALKEVGRLTAIINRSLAAGMMISSYKRAAAAPLLKKAGMDEEDMSSYRLTSNFTFLSKLIQKVLTYELLIFMVDISLHLAKIAQQRQLLLKFTVIFLIA